VQHATARTPASSCFARKVLVERQQQIEKPGIPEQGLVQVDLSFRFKQRKGESPSGPASSRPEGLLENLTRRACGADDDGVTVSEGLPRIP
jgi:hypothetical protein